MGFFSSLGRGLLGAAGGLLTGGPVGAVAGGLAGLTSGGGDAGRVSSSGTSQNVNHQQLRALTPQEQALQNQTYESLTGNAGMTPEEAASLRQQEYDRIFGASSGVINRTYDVAQSKGYANDAARGLAGSSASGARADARTGDRAFALSQASADAQGQAMQAALLERESRRHAAQSAMDRLNSIWRNRTLGSKTVVAGTDDRLRQRPGEQSFLGSVAGAVGSAISDQGSYLNRRLLGGQETPTTTDSVSFYDRPEGPGLNGMP